MEIKKVIVDVLPKCCNDCRFNICDDNNAHYCPCIDEKIPYEMYNFRAHLCPLKKEISTDLYTTESFYVGNEKSEIIYYNGDTEITKEEYERLKKEQEE